MFGVNLDDRLMSEDVSLETDDVTITFWGAVDGLGDWEGFECQYAVLHIDEGVPSVYAESDLANNHPYAVYAPAHGGHLGLAVANHSDESQVLTVAVDGSEEQLLAHLIDGEGWIPFQRETGDALLELPRSSAAILLPRRVVEA